MRVIFGFYKVLYKTESFKMYNLWFDLCLNTWRLSLTLVGWFFNNLYQTNISFIIDANLYFNIFFGIGNFKYAKDYGVVIEILKVMFNFNM